MGKAASSEVSAPRADAIGTGSQTLMRGLDVLEAVAADKMLLPELSRQLGLTKSTTYRLANALTERGYLAWTQRAGYRLGPRMLELGFIAQAQADLVQIARPHIEQLSIATGDTVHLGVLVDDEALYLDKQPGQRRIMISSRVGERQPLTSTGLGKALMLDQFERYWRIRLAAEQAAAPRSVDVEEWLRRMHGYVAAGRAYDLEENEDQIRCVAAPVRDASNRIVAAISVSSAAQYMDDARMESLSATVCAVAAAIGHDLGWSAPVG